MNSENVYIRLVIFVIPSDKRYAKSHITTVWEHLVYITVVGTSSLKDEVVFKRVFEVIDAPSQAKNKCLEKIVVQFSVVKSCGFQ